uniref:Uncharacterized protein n=1 Tax=Parastrongyloides trichosuri TaxID=131310 RepID=A0A0N4Z2U0_PARTI
MFVIPQQLNTLQKRPRIRIDNEQTNNIVIVDSTDSQVVAPQKRANVTDTLFRSDIVFSYDNLPSNISQRRIENSQKLTNRNLNTMICNDLIINRKIENTIVRNELIFDIIKDKIQKNINYEEVGVRIFNIIGLEPTINDYDKVCKTFDKKIFKISKNVTINEIILNQNKKINYILDFFIFDNNDNQEQQQVDQQNIDNNYIFNANIV